MHLFTSRRGLQLPPETSLRIMEMSIEEDARRIATYMVLSKVRDVPKILSPFR